MRIDQRTPRRRNDSRGQIAVLALVTLPALVGAMGLSVDLGRLYVAKRRLQVAADAAALAAAREHQRGNDANLVLAATGTAAKNAFTEGSEEALAIHHPPQAGVRAGDANFVEVVLTQDVPLRFIGYLDVGPITLQARAVAGVLGAPACVCVMESADDLALELQASASLTATGPGCEVVVASGGSQALAAAATACVAGVDSIAVRGGYQGTCLSPVPETGFAPSCDPNLTPPAVPGGCDYAGVIVSGGVRDLSPGIYCDGIQITAGTALLAPGLYILKDGGLVVSGGSVAGAGVTFYSTTDGAGFGRLDISGGTIDLTAASTGAFPGLLFFQDPAAPRDAVNTITGAGGTVVTLAGALYFPTQPLVVGAARVRATAIAARTLRIDPGSTLEMLPGPAGATGIGLALVE
jgi:hypothetical protein